jgi:hypothetical protein
MIMIGKRWFVLVATVLLLVTLSGCSDESLQKTTPAGPLGETIQFSQHPDIAERDLPEEQMWQYEAEIPVDTGTATPTATVRLQWNVFHDAPSRYLVSYSWEVLEPAEGVKLTPVGNNMKMLNIGTEDAVLEQTTVYLSWNNSPRFTVRSGTVRVIIGANGQWALPDQVNREQ